MGLVGIDNSNGDEGRRVLVAQVSLARQTLDEARSQLDLAVVALPEVGGDKAVATPALLMLLVGAVKAKERLKELEALLKRLVEGAPSDGEPT